MGSWSKPIKLIGNKVSLLPLQPTHRDPLIQAASDGKLWELWYTGVPSPGSVDSYIESALSAQEAGKANPFVVVEQSSQSIIGSTRYCNIEQEHQRLEIGATWYSKSHQRTGVNTECKQLLLAYAFEQLSAIAVEFRVHWHNRASRRAVERLGVKQDGVLRNHRIMPDGSYRDTVVYSIIENEWPGVRSALAHEIKRRG